MATHPDLMLSSQALKSAPLAMLMVDGSGRVTWANDRLAAILGISVESLLGNGDDKLVHMCLKRLLSDDEVIALPTINGNPECWLKCWVQDMPEQTGKGQLRYFTDVSEYIRTNDPVTGLLNQRSLVQGLDPQVSRSRRYNNPLSVVAMYLEGIEDMDERYGGSTRERVLVAIGQLLKDQMRWADLIAPFKRRLRLGDHDGLSFFTDDQQACPPELQSYVNDQVSCIPFFGGAFGSGTIWWNPTIIRLAVQFGLEPFGGDETFWNSPQVGVSSDQQ